MLATLDSAAIVGIDAMPVRVEVDLRLGMPGFNVVGLPDPSVKESIDRVRAAIRNSAFEFPNRRITVNLAPADIRKEGPSFDLPIALGILIAADQVVAQAPDKYLVIGELSLDGRVNRVNGALPAALCAKQAGKRGIVLPRDNAREAAVVEGLEVVPVESLCEAAAFLEGQQALPYAQGADVDAALARADYGVSFAEVKGQYHVKRALEVAAAGGHNVLMVGPPGAGKTMLARRLPVILPPLSREEAMEVTRVYSVAGLVNRDQGLLTTRPFRTPHHSASTAGLVGGGTVPKPGEVSLAHNGVLFLDELPEFERSALEVLRQPLEEGRVTIARAHSTVTFPARFMLVAAMNPCPCGFFGDPVRGCSCTPGQIHRYLMRISGPLLDRMDIQVEVPRLEYTEVMSPAVGADATAEMRARVSEARERQRRRFEGAPIFCNAQMRAREMHEFCQLDEQSRSLLGLAVTKFGLSARAYDRILKMARTIADLEGAESVQTHHLSEAIQYRTLDRKLWG
jgi:magnesium chelatase family protein